MGEKEEEDILVSVEWMRSQKSAMSKYLSQMGKLTIINNFTAKQRLALKCNLLAERYIVKIMLIVFSYMVLNYLLQYYLDKMEFSGPISDLLNDLEAVIWTTTALVVTLSVVIVLIEKRSGGDYFLDNARPLCILSCENCDKNGTIGKEICEECNSLGVIFQNIAFEKIAENLAENKNWGNLS